MKNVIIRNKANGGVGVLNAGLAKNFLEAIKRLNPDAEAEIYQPGAFPFDLLPEDVKHEAMETLKAYEQVTVEYGNEHFHVSAGCYIAASYPFDHCVFGTYYAKDVYTEEQRRANFREVFGYEMIR